MLSKCTLKNTKKFVKTLESFAKLSLKYSLMFPKYNVFSSSTNRSSHSIRAHFHLVGLLLQPDDDSSNMTNDDSANTMGSSDTTTTLRMRRTMTIRILEWQMLVTMFFEEDEGRGSRIEQFGSDYFYWRQAKMLRFHPSRVLFTTSHRRCFSFILCCWAPAKLPVLSNCNGLFAIILSMQTRHTVTSFFDVSLSTFAVSERRMTVNTSWWTL